jgi:hypothetical protein
MPGNTGEGETKHDMPGERNMVMSGWSGKPPLRVVHNLARSGGTLICRCLGSMRGVAVLSEIHPMAIQLMNPVAQAKHWFGLLSEDDCARVTIGFEDAIELIARRSAERGMQLVIREWSHWDYIGLPFVDQPRYRSLLVDILQDRFRLFAAAIVRHPIDQWLSLRELALIQGKVSLGSFLQGYRRYADLCVQTGFLRYEDFTCAPQEQLALLCRTLELNYDAGFSHRWPENDRFTGHRGGARGEQVKEIRQLPRRKMEPGLLEAFEADQNYREILNLLGYVHPE